VWSLKQLNDKIQFNPAMISLIEYKNNNVSLKKAIYLKDRTSFPTAATLTFQRTHPNPWLLSLALLAIQEENQPVYWSSLEQLI